MSTVTSFLNILILTDVCFVWKTESWPITRLQISGKVQIRQSHGSWLSRDLNVVVFFVSNCLKLVKLFRAAFSTCAPGSTTWWTTSGTSTWPSYPTPLQPTKQYWSFSMRKWRTRSDVWRPTTFPPLQTAALTSRSPSQRTTRSTFWEKESHTLPPLHFLQRWSPRLPGMCSLRTFLMFSSFSTVAESTFPEPWF